MLRARLLFAAFFFYVGIRKFLPSGAGLVLFDQLSAPQWFRYLNGILQIAGAAFLLMPRAVLIGIWLLACTMLALVVARLVVFEEPRSALPPAMILAMLIALAVVQLRGRTSSSGPA
jgi:hypothetical protein